MTRACRARVCWRRLRDWQAAGAWHRLHALLLAELRAAGRLELTRAIADSAHVRALKAAGSKHHILTDAVGVAPTGYSQAPCPAGLA
jgi:transposase